MAMEILMKILTKILIILIINNNIMAWENLKNAVAAVITANANNEITGDILRSLLNDSLIEQLGQGKYKGVATPITAPGTPQSEVLYIANQNGLYANFSGITVTDEVVYLKYNGSEWSKDVIFSLSQIQGNYDGTLEDLYNLINNIVFSGASTYQTVADLPDSPVPADNTPAKVANDADPANNGYYSVDGGVWVKDEPLVIDNLTTDNEHAALSAKQGKVLQENKTESGGFTGTSQSIYDLNVSKGAENVAFIKNILKNDLRDCSIFVCSDSTGNADTEWVYRFCDEFLKIKYPSYSVVYHLWNDGTETYSTVNLQTGSGGNTVHIYNAAISGAQPADFIGERKQKTIIDNGPYDLAIVNHGHNIVGSYTYGDDIKETRALYLELTEEMLQISPDMGVLVFAQSPWRDSDDMSNLFETVNSLCGLRGFGMVDVFTPFIKANKDNSLYLDSIHPSSAGTDLYLIELYKVWNGSATSVIKHASLFDKYSGINLLGNGTFDHYDTGVPDGWVGVGTTVTKESTIVDPSSFNNFSLKIEDGLLYYPLAENMVRKLNGKTVTYAVRMFVPDGETVDTGRIGLTSTGFSVLSPNQSNGQGGWRWKIITTKVTLDTIFYARVYGTASGTGVCYIDRAILIEGELPIDFLAKERTEELVLENQSTSISTDEVLASLVFKSNDASTNGVGEAGAIRVIAENSGTVYGIGFYTKNGATESMVARLYSDGRFNLETIRLLSLPTYADEAAASSLTTGDLYKTATGELRIKL